jgi:hypothetical protein
MYERRDNMMFGKFQMRVSARDERKYYLERSGKKD